METKEGGRKYMEKGKVGKEKGGVTPRENGEL